MSRAEVKQKWQATLADYQRSQLSIAAYCREHSITPASFYRVCFSIKTEFGQLSCVYE